MAGDSRLSARFLADTTDFKNGITEINRELKLAESEFRASAAALGDWSNSATGLETRIGALNKEIDLQKEKCGALSYQLEQLKAAHGENSVGAQLAAINLNKETETLNKMQNELKQTTGDLQKMGTQAKETGKQAQESGVKFKGFGDMIDDVKKIARNAGIILAGVAVTLKKAWDFAEEGAKIKQLEESFNSLMERMGEAPDILNELMAVTQGTVDDEDLMAATMRMLTGTSEELGKALLENAPMFLEIAKASNKLNPMLGSTIELYESLSTSIKNLMVRGLKQVGIVVDTTNAYEVYAKSIGKTATALTEEEMAMALLNAVLEKGQGVIDQVGGNTESATDRFERANVAIENLKDQIELGLVPVLGDLATAINLALTGGQGADVEGTTSAWENFFNVQAKGSKDVMEFATAYDQQVLATYMAIDAQKGLLGIFEKTGAGISILFRGKEGLLRQDKEARQIILQLADSYEEYIKAAEKAGLTSQIVKKEDQLLTQAEFEQYKAILNLAQTVDFATMSYEQFLEIIEKITGINAGASDSTGLLSDAIFIMARNIYDATHETEDLAEAQENGRNRSIEWTDAMHAGAKATAKLREEQEKLNAAEMSRVQAGIAGQVRQAVKSYQQGMDDLAKKRQEMEAKMKALGATDFIPALDVKKIAQYQSQLTGLWVSVHDLIQKRKEHEDFSKREQATWDETMAKVGALESKIKDLGGVPYLTADQRKELEELRKEYGACDEEARQLQAALRQATNEMIFQRAAAGLDAKATLELGRALGVISEEDYAVATVLDGLNKATASTDPGAYAAQVKAIADAIDRLHNKSIEVTVTTIQQEINAGAVIEHRTPTTPIAHERYARGGSGKVPPGYPNDSYPVWMTSGEEFMVTPTGSPGIASALARVAQDINAAMAQMNLAPNITMAGLGNTAAAGSNIAIDADINIYASPGMDEEMVAERVIDKLGNVIEVARSKGLR